MVVIDSCSRNALLMKGWNEYRKELNMSRIKVLANDDSTILEKAETQPRVFAERRDTQLSDCKEVLITGYNSGCVVITQYRQQ